MNTCLVGLAQSRAAPAFLWIWHRKYKSGCSDRPTLDCSDLNNTNGAELLTVEPRPLPAFNAQTLLLYMHESMSSIWKQEQYQTKLPHSSRIEFFSTIIFNLDWMNLTSSCQPVKWAQWTLTSRACICIRTSRKWSMLIRCVDSLDQSVKWNLKLTLSSTSDNGTKYIHIPFQTAILL